MSTIFRPLVTPTFEVLVVDDDPATVTALTDSVCESARFSRVGDGYRALHELTTRRIDAVVMELFLPGASGIELLRRMRVIAPRVPIVVLTHASGPYPELETLGVHHVLHKPASPQLLRAALTDVLAHQPQADLVNRADDTAA
jgi:two-component system OmpR family response regulator